MDKNWLSVYLYYTGSEDSVLRYLVHPFLGSLEDTTLYAPFFFFVRYFENGYHIRLRLFLSDQDKPVAEQLLEAQRIQYNLSGHGTVALQYAPYIPEIGRYGNEQTIHVAERQFGVSSKVILEWLCQQAQVSLSDRYVKAIKLHLAFFKSAGIEMNTAVALCDQFVIGWLPRLFKQALPSDQQRHIVLDAFEAAFLKYEPALRQTLGEYWHGIWQTHDAAEKGYLQVNASLLSAYAGAGISREATHEVFSSFIHMTNNRLGISNRDEAFVIYLVKKSILIINQHDDNDRQGSSA